MGRGYALHTPRIFVLGRGYALHTPRIFVLGLGYALHTPRIFVLGRGYALHTPRVMGLLPAFGVQKHPGAFFSQDLPISHDFLATSEHALDDAARLVSVERRIAGKAVKF